jgi:hypothetical protein
MNRFFSPAFPLLACALVLVSITADGQGRGSSVKANQDKAAREAARSGAKELAALETWLRRLIGRFTVPSGRYTWGPFSFESKTDGMADCIGIGSGPAVHCTMSINASGEQRGIVWVYLFGLDPDELKIRYMRVDGAANFAEGASGKLLGNSVTFRAPCFLPDVESPESQTRSMTIVSCDRSLRIDAPGDKGYIQIEDAVLERAIPGKSPKVSARRQSAIMTFPRVINTYRLERMPDADGAKAQP